jgi:hypothetical protein
VSGIDMLGFACMASLVQILLPTTSNEKQPYPRSLFLQVRQERLDRFGGVTAQLAAPSEGVWCDEGEVVLDSIVVFETMVPEVDANWWSSYRQKLEERFQQEEVVIRALRIERL